MKTRYIEDDDLDTDSSARELTLSPSTLLGIFFLLALVCAVFFGFGYSMGRRSANAPATAASTAGSESPLKATGDSKPAPGQANQAADLTPADAAASDAPATEAISTPDPVEEKPVPQLRHASATAITPQLTPAVAVRTPAPRAVSVNGVVGSPSALVQIAAVSRQEDATILVNALKKRGYTVAVRHEPQDKLLHIQLGPYATRKDAETMRQRLIADGYNAIVK